MRPHQQKATRLVTACDTDNFSRLTFCISVIITFNVDAMQFWAQTTKLPKITLRPSSVLYQVYQISLSSLTNTLSDTWA